MNRAIQRRWTRRATRAARSILRLCLALWLILQIVGTPLHLYLQPHSDAADLASSAASAWTAPLIGDDGHDDDADHERHSAAQHDLKVLRSARLVLGHVFVAPTVQSVEAEPSPLQPQVFDFSGLSPPELSRSWQFLFRAALPARAPSLLS